MPGGIRAEGLVKRYGEVTALDGLDLAVPRERSSDCSDPTGPARPRRCASSRRCSSPTRAPPWSTASTWRRGRGGSGSGSGCRARTQPLTNTSPGSRTSTWSAACTTSAAHGRARARDLLEAFRLAHAADRPVRTYSGGMRRRLDLAAALVAQPPILFLDEPTTGLDPRSRIDMWEVIRDLVQGGTTLLLTTQYLEEADRLADDIVVIDQGRASPRAPPTSSRARWAASGSSRRAAERGAAPARQVLTENGCGEVEVDERTDAGGAHRRRCRDAALGARRRRRRAT